MLKMLLIAPAMLFTMNSFSQSVTSTGVTTVKTPVNGKTTLDEKVYDKVEKLASFPGGMNAWVAFLQDNLKSNVPAKKNAPAGDYQVLVQFVVTSTGAITNISAITDHGYGMEKEVIRMIKKSPKWIPAQVNGVSVFAIHRQPVTFRVTDGKEN